MGVGFFYGVIMQIEYIEKIKNDSTFQQFTYQKIESLADTEQSKAIVFPNNLIRAVGVSWDTLRPVVEFTFDDETAITNDTAIWMTWDGVSVINTAATSVRINNNTGVAIVVNITLKTSSE